MMLFLHLELKRLMTLTTFLYLSCALISGHLAIILMYFFFFQAEDGIRDADVTEVQTCALPIWILQDLEAMPEVPREVRERPLARRMARDVREDPHVRLPVCRLLPEAPERRGDKGVRQARRGRRPGRYLGRGVPGDLTRAHHVIEGDDERRLRAGSEEGLEALDGIALP